MKKLIFVTTLVLAAIAIIVWSDRLSAPARAQAVVIDFENLGLGGPVTNQYAQFGVTFNNLTALRYPQTQGFTHSGALAAEPCYAQEFCSAPIAMDFTS